MSRIHLAVIALALACALESAAHAEAPSLDGTLTAAEQSLKARDFEAAAKGFTQVDQLTEGRSPRALLGLAIARRGLRQLEESLAVLDRLEASKPDDELQASALDLAAMNLYDLATLDEASESDDPRLADAARAIEAALAIDDTQPRRHLRLAQIELARGNDRVMLQHIRNAHALGLEWADYDAFRGSLPLPNADGAFTVAGPITKPISIASPQPQYTVQGRKNRTTGVVIVQVTIDEYGVVSDLRVLQGLPDGLTEVALEALKKWTWHPATLGGEPIPVVYNLSVNFGIR